MLTFAHRIAAQIDSNRCISIDILYNFRMSRIERRNQKRRDVVEAIVNRNEPIHVVARVFNVPQRTVFEWLSWFRAAAHFRFGGAVCSVQRWLRRVSAVYSRVR